MLSRSISTSRRLNRVSDSAALLFSWTLPHLDDFGNMEGGVDVLRGTIVPLRSWPMSKVEKCKAELCEVKAWQPYEVDGEAYIHCDKFEDYQTFKNDRGRIAEYPQPLESAGIQGNPPESYKLSKEKRSKESENGIPFSEFWNLYPKKVSKKQAEKAWRKVLPSEHTRIFEDVARRARSPEWQKDRGQFIPYPATYLNGERWKDQVDTSPPIPPPRKCAGCGKGTSSSWVQTSSGRVCGECFAVPVSKKVSDLKADFINKK